MFDETKFKEQLAISGLTRKELADAIGIDESTLYRKIQRKGDFTREEINRIIRILDIDNPNEIFFAQELA